MKQKVILFGGVFLHPKELETQEEVNKIMIPYDSMDSIIGIEYKRRTGTNLFYSDYQLSNQDREALEFQEYIENELE